MTSNMGCKTRRVAKLPIASQNFNFNPSAKSEPEEGVVLHESTMTKTENAFKGLSISRNNENLLNHKFSEGKGKAVDCRSWEDLLEENEDLKQQLETAKDCWTTEKRVFESKVNSLEEMLNEVLEKGIRSHEQEVNDNVRVSNMGIDSNNYEKLYKDAKEELRHARPLMEVGAVVRRYYLDRSQNKVGTWYGIQNFYNEINIPLREAVFAAVDDPNSKADLALYQCGFLDLKNQAELNKFLELYKLDVKFAIQQRILESRSQEHLYNLRAMLFTTTWSKLETSLGPLYLNCYLEQFLRLDQDITSLRPQMVEEGKPLYGENEELVEDIRVWNKINDIEGILYCLGVPQEDKYRQRR